MFTVYDLYKSLTSGEKLLSDYNAEFWNEYISNNSVYDRIFARLFKSFSPWAQDNEETLEEVKTNFIQGVSDTLRLNSKEFEELYKIHILPSDSYSLTNDFQTREIMDKDSSDNYGIRTDTSNNTKGSQNDTTIGKVSPYDSENFNNNNQTSYSEGSRSDSGSFIKGSQDDLHSENYTLTKEGNLVNATSNIKKHKDLWSKEDFYSYVFGVIAKNLLILDC